jgi:hypothetical protein
MKSVQSTQSAAFPRWSALRAQMVRPDRRGSATRAVVWGACQLSPRHHGLLAKPRISIQPSTFLSDQIGEQRRITDGRIVPVGKGFVRELALSLQCVYEEKSLKSVVQNRGLGLSFR